MEIVWDEKERVIRMGEYSLSRFTNYKNSTTWVRDVFRYNDYRDGFDTYTKEGNKAISDKLKCSRSVLYKHFMKLQKKVFIVPIYDILKKISNKYGHWDSTAIYFANAHKEKLQEAYKDGLYNLLPFIARTGLSPKELKEAFKPVWKQLCKNSLRKNKLLVKSCYFNTLKDSLYYNNFIALVKADIPSELLKEDRWVQVQIYLKNNFKGKWKNSDLMQRYAQEFCDTDLMLEQIGQAANPIWSHRRVQEEHRKLTEERNERYRREQLERDEKEAIDNNVIFDYAEDFNVKALGYKGYVATLLDTKGKIKEEGYEMVHCVGGYAGTCAMNRYLVYSITKDGERSSTLGISVDNLAYYNKNTGTTRKMRYSFSQHYKKYNKFVENEDEKELANLVVELLNTKEKE